MKGTYYSRRCHGCSNQFRILSRIFARKSYQSTFSVGKVFQAKKINYPYDDAGTSLIELLIAILVLAIVLAMGLMMMTTVSSDTAYSTHQGVSSETAQVALNNIEEYLSSAVTPASAELASGASSLPCTATSSSAPAITSADEYSLTFCGYPIGASAPAQTYTATIPSSSCTQSPLPSAPTGGLGGGYCMFEIIDDSLATPEPVLEVGNVWCGYVCQQADGTNGSNGTDANATTTSSPALFTYYAGSASSSPLSTPVASGSLGSVTTVVFHFTVLSNINPNLLLGPNGSPGTTLSRQIWLTNL